MPPKLKLHKSATKSASKPNFTEPTEPTMLDTESQQQFETELCWCIQQLQRTINSGKLNEKQVAESTKVLNMLMNNSTPFIKKRQVMRVTFGDYRAKMAEEDGKLSKVLANSKITPIAPNKRSVFMKKSLLQKSSSNNFKFNFKNEDTEHNVAENVSKISLDSDDSLHLFKFVTSDNSFRFNFEESPT